MFVENSETQRSISSWLGGLARLYPRSFDALLLALAFAVTVMQLYKTSSAVVLYQGF